MVGLPRLSEKGFIGTSAFLHFMAEEKYLHKGSQHHDFKTPSYACGEPLEHRPNLTDAQAQRLSLCPKCFPDKEETKVVKAEGWL
jgi:hypothetical protein